MVAAIVLAAGAIVYFVERQRIVSSTASTFESRAHLIGKYMASRRHDARSLQSTLERRDGRASATSTATRAIEAIDHYPRHGSWGVSGLASDGGLPELHGSLTGTDVLRDPSPAIRHELSAVLAIDHRFGTLLDSIPEIVWAYYTSASGFIHIAPAAPVAEFRFSETMYMKPFWAEAAPARNPERRQIISSLYDDYFGQGLMISISSPVEMNGEFTGVVSVDIGIELLRELADMGRAVGESILVDEHSRIVARAGTVEPGKRYEIPDAPDWDGGSVDALWITRDVVADELRLVHRLPRWTLALASVQRSLPAWIVLAALGALLVLSMRLHAAFARVRHLMHHDSLTGLLNRRGFQTDIPGLRELAHRHRLTTSVLLFDIDCFKRVNDCYGHDIGDDVLSNLARRLVAGVNEHDRVARWGGEEILVLLVHDRDTPALSIGERLRATVEENPVTAYDLRITVSGGLAEWCMDEALEAAVKRADDALYRAKESGRNRIESAPVANP